MPQTPGDDKNGPSLELPTLKLPGLGRRKRKNSGTEEQPPSLPEPATDREATPKPARSQPRPESRPQPQPQPQPAARAARRAEVPGAGLSVPGLPGRTAAALTGVATGIVGVGATYAALAGCEAVRGVSSCGGAPGFFILVAILVLMILLGAVLLKTFGVAEANSTSFLAVGIVAVVAMLGLLDVILSAWMALVVPALAAVAFLLAHWVTTRFEDEPTGRRDWT